MIHLNTTIKSIEVGESGEIKILGKASTPSTDRARDIILSDAWAKGGIDNYRKNPILLFNHNYDEPIGRVTNLTLTEQGLEVEGTVYEGSKSYPLIKNGVLKTFSVGFLIKDADYNKATDGLIIKDAELLEISVVSVPCNQDATFELSKSFEDGEFETLKKKFGKPEEEVKPNGKDARASGTKKMTEEELKAQREAEINSAVAKALEEKAATDKAAADAAAAEEAREKAISARVTASVETTVAEKVVEAVSKALAEGGDAANKVISEMGDTIKEQAESIKALQEARGGFFPDRSDAKSAWQKDPEVRDQMIEAFILSKALRRPLEDIDYTKGLMQKINTQSSVQVSSDSFEQEVSMEIQRDIEQELILAPMFRTVNLTSASQLLTIAPDTGYATHQTTGSTLPGTKPNGLLNDKTGAQPYALTEIQFRTDKLVSKAYLANDTEEDVLIPLLPLIRDGMVRQHAKSVDQMILTAGVVGGVYPNMVSTGLAKYATTGGRTVNGPSIISGDVDITGRDLLAARSSMGKYGIRPSDVVYVVSTTAYFQLLKDVDFYNNDEVGLGTKVTGEVGRMFGSRVMVSSELSETVAAGQVAAYAINVRNFVIPRLRGYTYEAEYSVDGQHWLLATTQRLGFTEVIPGAKSVAALAYVA